MKLLYLSSFHGTLEYDDLALFTEMGIDWFSTGLYLNPEKPSLEHAPRRPIDKKVDEALLKEFLDINPNYGIYKPIYLSKNIVDQFDIVLVSHCCPYPYYLNNNWDVIKHKPVIWRTYTQQTSNVEANTQRFRNEGLKIVRISPKERTIPMYAGDDAIIRGYVDDKEYFGWTGKDDIILTFNNFFANRTVHSNTNMYINIRNRMAPLPFELYGCENKNAPLSLGELSWEQVKQKYRDAKVYFALGSKPASLTYNLVEAMMTGCPVITWGKETGNMKQVYDWRDTYEAPDIIQNGINGFCFDDEHEIEGTIRLLLRDNKLAQSISCEARKTAIATFGKDKIKNDWQKFFDGII